MGRFAEALQSVAATVWVGGMWVAGFMVAPLLFAQLPDRTLAGMVAGKMFSLVSWTGLACAVYLLAFRLLRHRGQVLRQAVFWIVLVMLLMVCTGEFVVQPMLADLKQQALPVPVMESALSGRFAAWHGVSGVLYALQSLLGLVLVVLLGRSK